LKSFHNKVFAVHVEKNRLKTATVSIPLPIYTITVSTWTNHILKFSSMNKLLLDFLSRQSIPVSFAICIILIHLDGQMPSASLWNKHTIPHLCQKFVVISRSASFCSSISYLVFSTCIVSFLSFLLLSILATIFAVTLTQLNVRLSLHFAAIFFLYKTNTVTLGHCLFHLCCWVVLSVFWYSFLRFILQNIREIMVCSYL